MKRNTVYIVFLVLILILVCMYASSLYITEHFVTLSSKYKRKDGQDNTPCDVLRISISPEALEKWLIGTTTTKTESETTIESKEEPYMLKFLTVLEGMKNKCTFTRVYSYLDDFTLNKNNVRMLADIVNDVTKIFDKMVRSNVSQEEGMIDKLLRKYPEQPINVSEEAFTTNDFYVTSADLEGNIPSKSCTDLENVILTKYLTGDNLKYTHQTINGLERLFCECHEENRKIKQDIEKILKKKNGIDKSISIDEIDAEKKKNMHEDLLEMKKTIEKCKEHFNVIKMYVSAKVVELEFLNTLSS